MARALAVLDAHGDAVSRSPLRGDLRWDGREWLRWDDRRWSRALSSVRPDHLRNPAFFTREESISQERRERVLALAVEDQVACNGAHVVFQGPRGVIVGYPRHVSHGLHAVLTLVTGGLWAVVWLAAAAGRRETRVRLESDAWGNVWATPVANA
jgi:hypothetical protein